MNGYQDPDIQTPERRTALEYERAALQAANGAAPGWGAAVSARAERIKAIDAELAPGPVRIDTAAMLARIAAAEDPGT